ncbi:putative aminoglycoside phosphotransferase [Fusarium sporotrichioides]|uniref:Putative aminoglycoside phosphotransferase n=1 Tax=Fusarium sporotrichioides TaxID=5514 RepID=A0A395RCW1_FUSSP|nr:putative aminoglycoside phosphotransferase [Fusarium sporotrichioides]
MNPDNSMGVSAGPFTSRPAVYGTHAPFAEDFVYRGDEYFGDVDDETIGALNEVFASQEASANANVVEEANVNVIEDDDAGSDDTDSFDGRDTEDKRYHADYGTGAPFAEDFVNRGGDEHFGDIDDKTIEALNAAIASQEASTNANIIKEVNTNIVKESNANVTEEPNAKVTEESNANVTEEPNAKVTEESNANAVEETGQRLSSLFCLFIVEYHLNLA